MCKVAASLVHSGRCRGQVNANPAAQPPLAPPMGELSSEASLRGRRQWQVWVNAVIATGYPLSHDTLSIFATAYALSVTAAPCQLPHRGSQGAGAARPAQRASRCKFGGAAALPHRQTRSIQYNKVVEHCRRSRPWLSLWESWRASGEPERAQAVASLRIGAVIATGYPLSHGYAVPAPP